MVRKFDIIEFEQTEKQIVKPITKFGGQPVWLEEPQWPVSCGWDNRLMMFVGQIAIEKGMLGNKENAVAYIFVTHAEDYNDDFYDPDVVEWYGGENAVIIQPGGEVYCEYRNINDGPTLYDAKNRNFQYIPKIVESFDPDFIVEKEYNLLDVSSQNEYFESVDKNKIGGTPSFFRGDEWPEGDWKLLLQLKTNFLPFKLILGDMPVMYVFISHDFKRSGILIQD
ncbi:DUF1963 domain-containing protein [Clostridium estertheticum]|uniref:DUF1963 domain-containing protein n=1 Tax=Clostridium estertheticum TaxID=238834 RepID=A0A5N7IMU6_9CLOT|nr:DUF1963 domain-containing protein [Clostridium estertheticum]MPQ31638.1 DUF1963 domain-containing protein [Clostridium estertheticum]MPQ62310.1 DUF1963 domain-containing protein [Clostridium estertheticum]